MSRLGDHRRLTRLRKYLRGASEDGPVGDAVFLLRLLDEARPAMRPVIPAARLDELVRRCAAAPRV